MTTHHRPPRHRRGPRLGALLAGGALLLGAVVGCGSDSPSPDPGEGEAGAAAVDVLLDWNPNPDHVALYTAEANGDYEDNGVDPNFITPGNTADAAKEVSLGHADLAVSYEPDTILARGEGLDVISVASLIPTSLNSIVARGDSGIEGPEDLGGKTVAVSGVASQEPILRFIAREAGVDPDTMTIPNVQQNLNQALLGGQVDAVIGAFRNIEAVELREQGDFRVMPVTDLGVPNYSELVIIANPTRLREDDGYAERVRGFLAAVAAGQRTALDDPEEGIAALGPVTEGAYEPEMLRRMTMATLELLATEGFGRQDGADWDRYAQWMRENSLLDADVEGSSATTDEYLPGAD